jgi:phospholipid transport system substrate-binding protein
MNKLSLRASMMAAALALPAVAAAQAPDAQAPVSVAADSLEAARQQPKSLIALQYAEFDKLVAGGMSVEDMRSRIVARMDDFVDFTEFSRLTIKEQWDGLSPEKRTEFVGLFKQLIQRTYARKFKPDSKLTVTYRGDAEEKEGKARLQTTIASGGTEADVEYRFLRPEGKSGWWVFDIVIDDVSLMRNYRSQFQKIVKEGGNDALFAKLREKVEAGVE